MEDLCDAKGISNDEDRESSVALLTEDTSLGALEAYVEVLLGDWKLVPPAVDDISKAKSLDVWVPVPNDEDPVGNKEVGADSATPVEAVVDVLTKSEYTLFSVDDVARDKGGPKPLLGVIDPSVVSRKLEPVVA